MTDVTGFGLLGHLLEMCRGSQLHAHLSFAKVPTLAGVDDYVAQQCVPGGTQRNFASYGDQVSELKPHQQAILCDPQTSGGLLLAVEPDCAEQLQSIAAQHGQAVHRIGQLTSAIKGSDRPIVSLGP